MNAVQITQAIRDLLDENVADKNPLSFLLQVNMKFDDEKHPFIELEGRDGYLAILKIKDMPKWK